MSICTVHREGRGKHYSLKGGYMGTKISKAELKYREEDKENIPKRAAWLWLQLFSQESWFPGGNQ